VPEELESWVVYDFGGGWSLECRAGWTADYVDEHRSALVAGTTLSVANIKFVSQRVSVTTAGYNTYVSGGLVVSGGNASWSEAWASSSVSPLGPCDTPNGDRNAVEVVFDASMASPAVGTNLTLPLLPVSVVQR
jgi:hypothetical protein